MRITFIIPADNLAGGTRVVAIYADRLSKRGHDLRVICPRRRPKTLRQRLRDIRHGRYSFFARRQSHFDGKCVTVEYVEPPVNDHNVPDADIVIATWWETAEWVASLAPSKGAKAYFVQHHEVHSHIPKERSAATYRLPLQKICVANWLADVMRDEYGDDGCAVVPNAVDSLQFHAAPNRRRSKPIVGFLYSATHFKGCDICAEAVRVAREEIPSLRVIAFGGRRPQDRLASQVIDEFYPSPPQDELRTIYAKCCAWLFGSRTEGFGLPILEAMACRTPVIGTPVGAAPELISQGGGLLVKPEDPEDMARAILQMVNMSDADWQAMSDAAYHTATSYTWDDATRRFEAGLQLAIEQSRAANRPVQRLPM